MSHQRATGTTKVPLWSTKFPHCQSKHTSAELKCSCGLDLWAKMNTDPKGLFVIVVPAKSKPQPFLFTCMKLCQCRIAFFALVFEST